MPATTLLLLVPACLPQPLFYSETKEKTGTNATVTKRLRPAGKLRSNNTTACLGLLDFLFSPSSTASAVSTPKPSKPSRADP